MGYKDEQRETVNRVSNNASYNSSAGPKKRKKRGTREDFVEDVAEAVRKGTAAAKGAKHAKKTKKPMMPYGKKKGKGAGYDSMSVAELRKLLNEKKRNLLTKSGFPDGKLPRSKAAMIQLCKKFKRKRW